LTPIGLSYRPASLLSLAGWYNNPKSESTLSLQSGTIHCGYWNVPYMHHSFVKLYSKPQSTYIYRAPQCMSPRRNWGSPNPLAASECALPPGPKGGGGAHPPAPKGVGEFQFRRWLKILALCLLCVACLVLTIPTIGEKPKTSSTICVSLYAK
jgi:hypothetical protein